MLSSDSMLEAAGLDSDIQCGILSQYGILLPTLVTNFRVRAILADFVQWASPDHGLTKLQILAFGDFSYGGRYTEYNKMLCRSEGGFEDLSSSDILYWELAQRHMDMLEACPFDSIMD